MRVRFEKEDDMDSNLLKVKTHPSMEKDWGEIEEAILGTDKLVTVIDASTNRQTTLKISNIMSIESEGRMCNIKTKAGKMFLLNMRLKQFEETEESKNLIRINNQVMIGKTSIKSFRSAENARIEVSLQNEETYFVNRYYIKKFKENLS